MPTAQQLFGQVKPSQTAEDLNVYTPYSQISDRYPNQYLGINNENLYGETQTTSDKWGNAAVKFGATALGTFVQGTVGLVNGIYEGIKNDNFTSFYDNDLTKSLNNWQEGFENTNPTYYTNQEKNAAWYSPDTWATANFWSDTIFKNAGFSIGAIGAGAAWGGVFSAVGKAAGLIANGGKTAAQAMEAANAADAALLTRSGSALGDLNTTIDGIASNIPRSEQAVQWLKNATPSAKNLVRSVTAASGEAQIEAYHAKDTYLKDMKQKFMDQYGYEPEGDALRQLEDTASKIGNMTFGANMVLLTGTNLIQFPKIFGKAWDAERTAAARLAVRNAEGRIVRTGENVVADLAAGESYVASRGTNFVADALEGSKAGRIVNRASRIGRAIFSPSEAFEEGMQSIIPVSAQDYFDKGSDTKGDLWASFKKGVETELKDKDFYISVLSGGLTGALMEHGHEFRERGKQIKESSAVANAFNDTSYTAPSTVDALKNSALGSHMQEVSRSLNRAEVLSREAGDALVNNDRLTYEDKKTDMWLNYLLPRIQYGRADLVQEDIKGWKNLASTEEGWNELLKEGKVTEDQDREQFVQNMDKLSELAKTTQTHFSNLTRRYGSMKNEDGTSKYTPNNLMKLAYIGSKIDDYNKRINDLSGQVTLHGISSLPLLDTLSSKADDFDQKKAQSDKLQEFAEDVKRQLDARNDLTIEQKEDIFEQLSDLSELTLRRNLKIGEYETYRDNPEAFDDTQRQDQEADEQNAEPEVAESTTGENTNAKKAFALANEGQQFQLNFGRRGNQVGELVYNEKKNILAVKTEQGLHEVTNQDFKDGLVSRVDPTVQDDTYNPFLQEADNRTEVKRQNTINQISKLQRQKQEKLKAVEERINKVKSQLADLRNRSELETNGKILESFNNLTQEANTRLSEITLEQNDLLDQLGIYQDILDNRTFDYAMVLNDVESLMDKTNSIVASLEKEKGLIQKLLDTVKQAVKYWTGMLRDKISLRQRSNPNDINLSLVGGIIDRFLEDDGNLRDNILNDQIQNINNLELQPSKAQRDKLQNQLEDINDQIEDIQAEQKAREQVYAEMMDQVLSVENPISPEDFITQEEAETIVEQQEEVEEPTEISTIEKLFVGAKKKLSNFFTSTKSVPDGFKEAWYTRYNKASKAIVKMPKSERAKLRTIFITANNEEALGAKGLIDSMFLREGRVPYFKNKQEALHPINGGIAAVIISEDEKGNRSFIGEDGRIIGKVGETIDPKKLVGSKMSGAKLDWNNGQEGFVQDGGSPEDTLTTYQSEREKILQDTSETPAAYKFTLSRGVQKNKGQNRIVGNLLNREDVGKAGVLSIILKDGVFTTPDGQEHTATTKFVMVQTEDSQVPVQPRKFDNDDAQALALAVKEYAIHTVLGKGNSESLAHFIKTHLPYNTKFTSNSLQLNTNTVIDFSVFHEGTEEQQAKALDTIQSYLLTRNIKVANDLQQPFTEYFMNQEILDKRDWPTYQEYLLANEYGTDPRGNQPVLLTSVADTDNRYIQLSGFMGSTITNSERRNTTSSSESEEIPPAIVQLQRVNAYDLKQLEGFKRENIVALGNTAALVDEDTRKEFLDRQALAKNLGVKFIHPLKEIAKAFPNQILDLRGMDMNRGSAALIDQLNGITPEQKADQHSNAVRQQFRDILLKELKGRKGKEELLNVGMNLLEQAAKDSGDVNAFYGQYSVVTKEDASLYKPNLISNLDAIIKNNGGRVTVDTGSFEVDIFEGKAEITDVKGAIPQAVYDELNSRLPAVDAERERILAITDLEERKSAEIAYIMGKLFSGVGEASANKIREYADRIISGTETREKAIQGLPKSFVEGIDQLLAVEQNAKIPLNQNLSIDELNALGLVNSSLYQQGLYDKISEVAKALGIQIRFQNETFEGAEKAGGFYDRNTGNIIIQLDNLRTGYENLLKGEGRGEYLNVQGIKTFEDFLTYVITHEMIHSTTENAYDDIARNLKDGKYTGKLDAVQVKAVNSIFRIFNHLKTLDLGKEYGLVNMNELMAEMANEEFVNKLKGVELSEDLQYSSKNKNLFESIINYLKDLFFGKSAADSILNALSDVLTTPQAYTFSKDQIVIRESTPFQIIGAEGAANDQLYSANLDIAKQMLSEGEDMRSIKYATGFEFDEIEQKWKGETEDTFKINSFEDGTLEERLDDADELFKLYPSLKDVELRFLNTDEYPWAGSYDQELNTIWINEKHIREDMVGNYEANVKQITTHEIQHIVQDQEGFENGGMAILEDGSDNTEAMSNYLNLAGEVEARNAVNRSDMSMEERQETLLSDTEDVAKEDKIYTGAVSKIANLIIDKGQELRKALKENNIQKFSELFNIPVSISSFQSFINDPQPEITEDNINNANLAVQISALFTLPEQTNIYEQPSTKFLERLETLKDNLEEISVPLSEYLDDPAKFDDLNLLNQIQPEGLPVIEATC